MRRRRKGSLCEATQAPRRFLNAHPCPGDNSSPSTHPSSFPVAIPRPTLGTSEPGQGITPLRHFPRLFSAPFASQPLQKINSPARLNSDDSIAAIFSHGRSPLQTRATHKQTPGAPSPPGEGTAEGGRDGAASQNPACPKPGVPRVPSKSSTSPEGSAPAQSAAGAGLKDEGCAGGCWKQSVAS